MHRLRKRVYFPITLKHYHVLAKYAYYDANEANGLAAFNKNTHKFWLQGGISF
ncbi:MAG: hypothetical protein H0A75_07590 [Candidatus Methanofishera endochildressiae]|uniref:Uncharacterized protein n=1 Tax=Candidatus Methanofishera endochildressiae TaxID=2738884 RepID=A0A7Z0MPE5_9GAMM|nr:hypothetical protein [Candidatus Methanofishera endochildressiae]